MILVIKYRKAVLMILRPLVVFAVAMLILPSIGCGVVSPGSKPLALASTSIFADMAKNVAGARMEVASLVPIGGGVEDYEPKPEDARRVAQAKVVFVNGFDLDRWSAPLLKGAKANVVTLTEGLPAIENGNPHMWFDAQLAKKYVERMRDAFIASDATGSEIYTSNAVTYNAKLDALDQEIRTKAATIPSARRVLVTSHDAFPYFARAYSFRVVGFVQPEPGKDPSPSELAKLVATVKAAGVPAIFSEVGITPRLAETLAKEAGVSKVVADLPTDSLADAPADSYIGVMRVIIDAMVSALR